MPRNRQLALIENVNKRSISFNRRTLGMVKSTKELSVLCGVDCCLIVNNQHEGKSVVWPSVPHEMDRGLARYISLPEYVKDQNKFNQEDFIKKMVDKVEKKGNKLMDENRQKGLSDLVCQCLADHENVYNYCLKDLVPMSAVIEAKLKDVDKRLEFLLDQPPSEPTQDNGKEVIVIPDTLNQNEMTLAEPRDLGKGKEVMKVLPFDLNRVQTEKDDPDIAGTWWVDPSQLPSVINDSNGAGPSGHP